MDKFNILFTKKILLRLALLAIISMVIFSIYHNLIFAGFVFILLAVADCLITTARRILNKKIKGFIGLIVVSSGFSLVLTAQHFSISEFLFYFCISFGLVVLCIGGILLLSKLFTFLREVGKR